MPVRFERFPAIPIRVRILTTSTGENAATTPANVLEDIATANLLWSQAAVKFELAEPISYHPSSQYLNPDVFDRSELFDVMQNTGGFEVYYANNGPNIDGIMGITDPGRRGIIICVGNFGGASRSLTRRVLAHEFGHSLVGIGHRGTPGLQLMAAFLTDISGDILESEVTDVYTLQQFSHN